MTLYHHSVNIKAGLFVIGIVLAIALLGYSNHLVEELQTSERRLVDFYARLIAKAASEAEGTELNFVFDEIIRQIQFPVVVTNQDDEIVSWRNVDIPPKVGSDAQIAYLRPIIRRMDATHAPVDVLYNDMVISRIHYGDSGIVSKLRWLPIVEITSVALFILIGFAGFSYIRNSEKQSLWVGLSKETAHQLGTPVSSLMGWVELLPEKLSDDGKILSHLKADIQRLEQIADRFSKIGSKPRFTTLNLQAMASESAEYFRRRIAPNNETTLSVSGESINILGAETLLQWALENLIKNALDACKGKRGRIQIRISASGSDAYIDVADNGVGIQPRERKNIFRPGYSTKPRGWGLGLSLTRRIVESLHKGKLRLVSSKPGETVIRITLPLEN